jgi:hypothetical protein
MADSRKLGAAACRLKGQEAGGHAGPAAGKREAALAEAAPPGKPRRARIET